MGIFDFLRRRTQRRTQQRKDWTIGLKCNDEFKSLLCSGYSSLADNPEVGMCVDFIADCISNMTIHLMQNTDAGDRRLINELSKKIDINPTNNMTKKTWLSYLVRIMLLEGEGNAFALPIFEKVSGKSLIKDLKPLPYGQYSVMSDADSYSVTYKNTTYKDDALLHFYYSPDPYKPFMGSGVKVRLRDICQNLKQANKTINAFMTDKYRPSVIISVNGMTDDMSQEEGRQKIIEKYLDDTSGGSVPWVIPDELIKVDQVKPLSLKDIALNDNVEIDKKTIAGIFGVPAFVVKAGEFNQEEYNNFIQTKILSIATAIQQELTRKLIIAEDRYFKFNYVSLYNYNLETLAETYSSLFTRGIVTGNEVRDKIGLTPKKELEELVILENFIPVADVGNQKKLTNGKEQ